MRMCKPLALEGRGVGERVSFRHKSESFDFQTFKFKMDSRFRGNDDGGFWSCYALAPRHDTKVAAELALSALKQSSLKTSQLFKSSQARQGILKQTI